MHRVAAFVAFRLLLHPSGGSAQEIPTEADGYTSYLIAWDLARQGTTK